MSLPKKLRLAHLPTPVWRHPALDRLVGAEVWVKRDDMTAGAEAGNKIRKLEYLLADALHQRADLVLTCGAAQSNHARATALLSRQVGLDCWLFLRTQAQADERPIGNLLLDRLASVPVHFVTPTEYAARKQLLEDVAAQQLRTGRHAYIIPEGGSNGLGSLGYVDAMFEVEEQARLGLLPAHFDQVVFACGSGGTAAGVALGLSATGLSDVAHAIAVCDDRPYFEGVCAQLVAEARALRPQLGPAAELRVSDEFKGPSYGVMSAEQQHFLRQVATETGLVVDPVYSGKALFALSRLAAKPRRALFIHTGGLPGLLAHPAVFDAAFDPVQT